MGYLVPMWVDLIYRHHFTGYLALESTGKSVSVNTGGPGVDETGSPTSVIKVLGGDLQRGLDVYMRHLKDDDTLHSSLMAPSSSPRMWEAFRTCLDQEGASGSLMTIKVSSTRSFFLLMRAVVNHSCLPFLSTCLIRKLKWQCSGTKSR